MPDTPEVIVAIADLCEQLDDMEQACEWYNTLISIVPSDPSALSHLGDLFDRLDDKSQAFQHHFEVAHLLAHLFLLSYLHCQWMGL